MRETWSHVRRVVLVILVLIPGAAYIDHSFDADLLHEEAEAQFADDVWRIISKAWPSTSRRMSRKAKGEIGEENIESALRVLGRNMDEVFEMERIYLRKGALDQGIDGFYRGISRNRFAVVEAKATTARGMLYEGTLGNPSAGRQMSTRWIRQSLDNAEQQAWRIMNDDLADTVQKRAAREILDVIGEVKVRTLRRTDRVLVVTRLVDLDVPPGVGSSIHHGLARHFDNIIEVNRRGKVRAVFAGTH